MALTVLVGGARSGKSSAAQSLAAELGQPVTYLATATAGDEEMAERINRHRSDRPSTWATVEEPLDLSAALGGIVHTDTVVIDCLTLWLTNMMGTGATDSNILAAASTVAGTTSRRPGETIVVTNEVGLGLVPPNPLGRRFRDLAGQVNRLWVEQSARAGLVVAGRILPLLTPARWNGWNE